MTWLAAIAYAFAHTPIVNFEKGFQMNPKREAQAIFRHQTPAQKAAELRGCELAAAAVDLIGALKDSYRNEIDAGCLSARLKHANDSDYVIISSERDKELIHYRYDGRSLSFITGFLFQPRNKIEMMQALMAEDPHASFPKQPSALKPK